MADADTDVTVPAPRLPGRPPRRRRQPRALLIGVLTVTLAVGARLGVQAWRVSNALGKIKHFPTTVTKGGGGAQSGLALPAPLLGVVTFMVFTTGSHDMTKTDAVKYGVPDVKARGTDNMTDTIVLVSVDTRSGQISYLSISRDTWVPRYGEKINEIYLTNGVQALVNEVQAITGVPVPTRDAESHLLLPSAGCVHMDGAPCWRSLAHDTPTSSPLSRGGTATRERVICSGRPVSRSSRTRFSTHSSPHPCHSLRLPSPMPSPTRSSLTPD